MLLLVLIAGQRLHERPDVGDNREFFVRKQARHFRKLRVKRVRCSGDAVDRRTQVAASERQARTQGLVRPIAGIVHGNDRVVGIIATEQENTDQCPIIRTALRHGRQQTERAKCQRTDRGCTDTNESATCEHFLVPY